MISNVPEQATPPIMPFYGSTAQPGAQMMESVGPGFGAPLRDRFAPSWPPPPQPTDAATLNGLSTWAPVPPQTQFIQQVNPHHPPHHPHHPHQLDELRYHHPQYASTPSYHQTTGYQQAFLVDPNQQTQPTFQQQAQLQAYPNSRPPSSPAQQPLTPRSVGTNYSQQAHTPQPSPTPHQVNGVNGNVPQRNGINGQYMDSSSGQSMEYVNGSYNPSQDGSMAPPPSTTPTSRSSSVHMDTGGGGGGGAGDSNGSLNGNGSHAGMNGGSKTPVSAYQASPVTSTPSNSGNAMPGYPLHQAPQTLIHQQSSHNSSGYPGQEMTSGIGESSVSSPQHWNASSNNHINNQQQNNSAGGAGANGTTNASANRSIWNGSNPEQSSPLRPESSPQQHSNNTSPVSYGTQQQQQQQQSPQERTNLNSRLKTMILNKQQMQQQYNQQMQYQVYNQQMQLHSPHPDNGQSPDPKQEQMQHEEQEQQEQQQMQQEQQEHPAQQFMIGHITAHNGHAESHESNNQNLAGNFLVQGHHLRELMRPEGGGQWAWSAPGAAAADNATVVDSSKNGLNPEEVSGDNHTASGFSGSNGSLQMHDWDPEGYREEKNGTERQGFHGWTQEEDKNDSSQQENVKVKREGGTCDYPIMNDGSSQACLGTSGTDERRTGVQNLSDDTIKTSDCKLDEDKLFKERLDRLRNNVRVDIPLCDCFPPDKLPPEPGSYYTHLGTADSLPNIRIQIEARSGYKGNAVRIEKVLYTGKEGKTVQGCPLAKWIIRRSGMDEKILVIVKHRQGHQCATAWIIVAVVAWEGVPPAEADHCYSLLTHKLNRFGLPTTRRCATNEPRTCACQGLDPNTCGASFSFGCSWSMYYNGCKYARSKTVRKFRLSVKSEEQEMEERMNVLSTLLSPLYQSLVPEGFRNQTEFEDEAGDCRLGYRTGRPFSGVTACIDFCAHTHRDLHNMNNGCTVVVSLTKHRSQSKPDDEQLHVLPLYILDDSDEFGSKETQLAKTKSGALDILTKFPCEVRMRSVPLQPCRRHGKKRRDGGEVATQEKEIQPSLHVTPPRKYNLGQNLSTYETKYTEIQLQSAQVTSTVSDIPGSMHRAWNYANGMSVEWNRAAWNLNVLRREEKCLLHETLEEEDPDSTTVPATCTYGTQPILRATQIKSDPDHLNDGKNCSYLAATKGTQHQVQKRLPTFRPTFHNLGNNFNVSRESAAKLLDCKPGTIYDSYSELEGRGESNEAFKSLMLGSVVVKQENEEGFSDMQSYSQTDCAGANYAGFPSKENCVWANQYQGASVNSFHKSEEMAHCSPSPYRHLSSPRMDYHSWDLLSSPPMFPTIAESPNLDAICEVTDFVDNEESFKDSQMGGVAIALGHGSVLFECAKHEMHSTTALRRPDRSQPTRISLVFYQHRNLNRPKHGWMEWEEKMRVKKQQGTSCPAELKSPVSRSESFPSQEEDPMYSSPYLMRTPSYTTTTWTTLFPMHPYVVTGPYHEE